MTSVLIDGEWLAVALPEGFEVIEHQELETLMDLKYKYMWGVRHTERHMLLRVTWKDSNKLITKLVSERSFAKQIDKKYARCRPGSGYRSEGIFERSVTGADAPAQGFRFSYTVEGVGQCGEVLVFKRGIRCYTLVYYTRSEVAEQNQPTYEGIIASLELR